jgi:hypothetical protein
MWPRWKPLGNLGFSKDIAIATSLKHHISIGLPGPSVPPNAVLPRYYGSAAFSMSLIFIATDQSTLSGTKLAVSFNPSVDEPARATNNLVCGI